MHIPFSTSQSSTSPILSPLSHHFWTFARLSHNQRKRMAARKPLDVQKAGDQTWAKVDKISSELFTLTYGALVTQMLKDMDNPAEVNTQLEKMGYNIGIRLIDDFLANSGLGRCNGLRETADVIAKAAFKAFLGVTATVSSFDDKKQEFTLLIEDNPLADFVELPDEYKETLHYSNLLCGVIRGALEMVQMRVECSFTKDALKGDDITELRVKLLEILKEDIPNDE